MGVYVEAVETGKITRITLEVTIGTYPMKWEFNEKDWGVNFELYADDAFYTAMKLYYKHPVIKDEYSGDEIVSHVVAEALDPKHNAEDWEALIYREEEADEAFLDLWMKEGCVA